MKKQNVTAVFLAVCLVITMSGMNPSHAHANSPSYDNGAKLVGYVAIEPNSIGLTAVLLERRNSNTLFYRVTANSSSGMNTSISARIVLQRLESGRWVDREIINVSQNNTMRLDVGNLIDIRAHGSGSYRIRVTFTSVVNGIVTTLSPRYSTTVVM